MKLLCLFAVCVALIVPLKEAAAADKDVSSLIERGDAAWEKRGADGAVENREAADLYLAAAAAAPFNYEAHWKDARSLWWIADQGLLASDAKDRQRELGRRSMELAGRAALISPNGYEGRLYRALAALHYCYGIGMVEALKQGIQDEAARHLTYCYEKSTTADRALALLGLSALYRTALRPIRDINKSVAYAREAVSAYPTRIRAAVFLAAAGSYEESMSGLAGLRKWTGTGRRSPTVNGGSVLPEHASTGGRFPIPIGSGSRRLPSIRAAVSSLFG